MQQAMLFHHQLAPESGVYVQQLVGSLHEELDVAVFQKAWEGIVARHQALRTAIRWQGLQEPQQDVYSQVELPFETQDWQHLSESAQNEQFEQYLKADSRKGFKLEQAPLMRLVLFQLGRDNYRFIWTYHHIIVDGRSRQVIVEEVFDLYESIRQGKDLSRTPSRPYQEYIDWLQQRDFSKSESYWRTLLEGFKTPNQLSPSRTSSFLDEGDRDKSEIEIGVSETVTAELKRIAQENGLTLNSIVQGAWALLVSRYCNEEDVVFGVVRAGRHWGTQTGDMVGLFVNTVPTRIPVPRQASLLPWLKEIRQQIVDVREHEYTPMVDIQKWSDMPPGKALFESIFVYYEMETFFWSGEGQWQNRDFKLLEDNGFAITVDVYASSDIGLKITYDRHQFDDDSIKRMLGHLKTLLESIAHNPDRPVAALPMLTDAEYHQIMVEWNATGVDYPRDRLIHQVFEAQAASKPDATALVFEGEHLTYAELDRRANQLAHYLQSIGVGPESLVGIAVERSIEMIVGLYGILKAGGAYLPLDPTYPADRLAYMMEDADVSVLLTQKKVLARLPSCKAQVVCLDTDWDGLIGNRSTETPVCPATLENLAYVIYTSGSTGKPKGAMNTHAAILNRLFWMQDAYRMTEADAVLQKTPFSFDVSVWEFFWPLMFGARLVVARPEGHKDSDYLARTIIEQQITTIHFVPSMLQVFLMAQDIEKCTSLRQVICSGEALPVELQNRFFERLNAKLHNLYGPTEAAVDVTYWECQRDDSLDTVPIGRPVANTQIYILDNNMMPVPVMVPGELYIGGVQVARGYLNKPELTAEKFIPDPFGADPKGRLYRTGDSTRYLPDGNIEYLGRLDFQVKIRGNRVELGEIEALLGRDPAVREVVVLVREDVPDDKRLVAYLVLNQGKETTAAELRDYLKHDLPDFMVPSHFIILDKMPLSPNQKVDRKALPAPEKDLRSGDAYVAPKNELQRTIANVWQEVLNIPEVGINDNFFELGGHSLLLVQVYYKLSGLVSKEFALTDMFKFPTIDTLAEYLAEDEGGQDTGSMQESMKRADARRSAIMHRQRVRQREPRT